MNSDDKLGMAIVIILLMLAGLDIYMGIQQQKGYTEGLHSGLEQGFDQGFESGKQYELGVQEAILNKTQAVSLNETSNVWYWRAGVNWVKTGEKRTDLNPYREQQP